VKAKVSSQVLPAGTGVPVQVFPTTEKSVAAGPLIDTLDTCSAVEPQFVIVILKGALVTPTSSLEKLSGVLVLGHTSGAGAVAIPVMGMLRGLPT
jgi:hypothetical protein